MVSNSIRKNLHIGQTKEASWNHACRLSDATTLQFTHQVWQLDRHFVKATPQAAWKMTKIDRYKKLVMKPKKTQLFNELCTHFNFVTLDIGLRKGGWVCLWHLNWNSYGADNFGIGYSSSSRWCFWMSTWWTPPPLRSKGTEPILNWVTGYQHVHIKYSFSLIIYIVLSPCRLPWPYVISPNLPREPLTSCVGISIKSHICLDTKSCKMAAWQKKIKQFSKRFL